MTTITEFDAWKHSSIGKWFFETVLQGYADSAAGVNGRYVGLQEETTDKEFMTFVRNAGVIQGVEYAVNVDPFIEEREELEDEAESDRQANAGEDGL